MLIELGTKIPSQYDLFVKELRLALEYQGFILFWSWREGRSKEGVMEGKWGAENFVLGHNLQGNNITRNTEDLVLCLFQNGRKRTLTKWPLLLSMALLLFIFPIGM